MAGFGRAQFSRKLPGQQERTIGSWQIRQSLACRSEMKEDLPQDVHFWESGGTVTALDDCTKIEAADEGNRAEVALATMPTEYTSGRVIGEWMVAINEDIDALKLDHELGFISNGMASGSDNPVVFRHSEGDETDGNISVMDDDRNVHTGSFSFDGIVGDGYNYYSIVIDFDRDETRFLMDENPFLERGTVIPHTPARLTHPGGKVENNVGNGYGFEQMQVSAFGYQVVP